MEAAETREVQKRTSTGSLAERSVGSTAERGPVSAAERSAGSDGREATEAGDCECGADEAGPEPGRGSSITKVAVA